MMFWLSAFAIMAACAVFVLWPSSRRDHDLADSGDTEIAHDIEVYRDQLAELEREAARGAMSQEDAEQARTEIGRRLLAAEERQSVIRTGQASSDRRFSKVFLASLIIVVFPALSLIVYNSLGSPGMEAQPLAPRIAQLRESQSVSRQAGQEMQALIVRAEEHLASNPGDGRGWDVLAPVYLRMGRPGDAVAAYTKAIEILGENTARLTGLGEADFAAAGGIVTQSALKAFRQAMVIEPENARARFFIGLAEAQAGNSETAEATWQALASDTGADARWRASAEEGLRRLATGDLAFAPEAEAPPAAPSMPQLDRETIAESGSMSEEDRAAMIEDMVARLDARLETNPNDAEGWMRLIRAYVVLNQEPAAQNALNRALESFGDDTETANALKVFAQSLGLREAPNGGDS